MIQTARKSRVFTRLTAMLLVAAISFGTILPLVWCFGGADHSAIEFKVAGTASTPHDARPASEPVQLAAIAADDKYHPRDCVDRDVFPPTSLTNETDAPLLAASCAPAHEIGLAKFRTTAASATPHRPITVSPSANGFPALKQLKTVKLLT